MAQNFYQVTCYAIKILLSTARSQACTKCLPNQKTTGYHFVITHNMQAKGDLQNSKLLISFAQIMNSNANLSFQTNVSKQFFHYGKNLLTKCQRNKNGQAAIMILEEKVSIWEQHSPCHADD